MRHDKVWLVRGTFDFATSGRLLSYVFAYNLFAMQNEMTYFDLRKRLVTKW